MPRMTRASLGRATQARFLVDALERNMLVSLPFDSIPGYDAIVDTGHRLLRIQIKGARPLRNRRRAARQCYRVFTNKRRSTTMAFDLVAVWLAGERRWVFLPGSLRYRRCVVITVGGGHDRVGWEVFNRFAAFENR